ncbi:hypothetical protein B0T14DRAFT_97668 [Immersiella caudata]|uniref:Uncharacterized protein n=1 Tax=Immersiella caudata TaxID=314043 RepID=A0AA39X317_9PEZI|nr:hypothetical protein B0T14DRAFT_97668 [Immersiella caudata]
MAFEAVACAVSHDFEMCTRLSTPPCSFDTDEWVVVRLNCSCRGSRLQLKGPNCRPCWCSATRLMARRTSTAFKQRSNNVLLRNSSSRTPFFCHRITVCIHRYPAPQIRNQEFKGGKEIFKHPGGCRRGISVCAGLSWRFMPTGLRQGREAVLKHFRSIFGPLVPGSVVIESRGEGGVGVSPGDPLHRNSLGTVHDLLHLGQRRSDENSPISGWSIVCAGNKPSGRDAFFAAVEHRL